MSSIRRARWGRRSRTSAFLVLLAASGCAINPVSGNRELALVSEAQEIEMGRQGAAAVAATIGLDPDATLQAYVDGIGQALAARTERPQLAWEFHVVDDASVNAFALPGGFIFVTRGLLTHMTSEAELASVLGHEAGHVAARHSVQQISRQQVAALGIGLGSVLSSTIADYAQVAGAGLGLLFLKYGRDDETQADQLGFRYALADGYDTREMVSVFEMLQQGQLLSGGGRLPTWQATHPDPETRIQDVRSLIAASPANFGSKRIGEDEFMRRIDSMVYGENPRAGFFQDGLFVHPDLQFVLRFPDAWTTHNANDAVTGLSPDRDALIQLRGGQGSVTEAAQQFFAQEGVQAGPTSRRTIHGNRAITGEFSATTARGEALRGIATFIDYRGATWSITAFASAERFASYRAAFQQSLTSFERLTDPAALAVQPMRLRVDRTPRAMSLREFDARSPSSIPLAELAMINGVDADARLGSGRQIKRVVGRPVPRVAVR